MDGGPQCGPHVVSSLEPARSRGGNSGPSAGTGLSVLLAVRTGRALVRPGSRELIEVRRSDPGALELLDVVHAADERVAHGEPAARELRPERLSRSRDQLAAEETAGGSERLPPGQRPEVAEPVFQVGFERGAVANRRQVTRPCAQRNRRATTFEQGADRGV